MNEMVARDEYTLTWVAAMLVSNGAGILPPVQRPRLVAKSAGLTKPTKTHFGSRNGSSGPDPMQVWNRNRGEPIAIKETIHFR